MAAYYPTPSLLMFSFLKLPVTEWNVSSLTVVMFYPKDGFMALLTRRDWVWWSTILAVIHWNVWSNLTRPPTVFSWSREACYPVALPLPIPLCKKQGHPSCIPLPPHLGQTVSLCIPFALQDSRVLYSRVFFWKAKLTRPFFSSVEKDLNFPIHIESLLKSDPSLISNHATHTHTLHTPDTYPILLAWPAFGHITFHMEYPPSSFLFCPSLKRKLKHQILSEAFPVPQQLALLPPMLSSSTSGSW